jgi:hypothetical protein
MTNGMGGMMVRGIGIMRAARDIALKKSGIQHATVGIVGEA